MMPLPMELRMKLDAALNPKGVTLKCAVCSSTNIAPKMVVGLIAYDPATNQPSQQATPAIYVACHNCGYLMLFASTDDGTPAVQP